MAGQYTEAQKNASLKYQSKKVCIQIRIDEEQRERYRAKAEEAGMSLTQYIIKKLEE